MRRGRVCVCSVGGRVVTCAYRLEVGEAADGEREAADARARQRRRRRRPAGAQRARRQRAHALHAQRRQPHARHLALRRAARVTRLYLLTPHDHASLMLVF